MGFNEYISELLFEHNCVIVPGFGGLVANTGKARINTLTHEIFPPCKTVAFNQKLDHNDGLLANYLVRKLGVTYDEAMVRIDKFSRQIGSELKTNNSFTIPAVGNFYLNKENSIQFVPAEDSNFLYGSFGLSPVTLPGVPANREAVAEVSNRKSSHGRKIQWLVGTAATLLIVSACIFSFRSGLFKLNHNVVTLNPFDTILGDSENTNVSTGNADKEVKQEPVVISLPAPAETATTDAEKQRAAADLLAAETESVEPVVPVAPVEIEAPAVHARKFYIIGGAFQSSFNAHRYKNMLQKKGFTAGLAGQNRSGLIRVSYESYTDSLQAASRLEFIKSNENQSAWILAQ